MSEILTLPLYSKAPESPLLAAAHDMFLARDAAEMSAGMTTFYKNLSHGAICQENGDRTIDTVHLPIKRHLCPIRYDMD